MGIDQAWHQRRVAQIDQFSASRMRDVRARLADAIALNQQFSWRDDLAGGHVEYARGVQHDGMLRQGGLLRMQQSGGAKKHGDKK